jgi:opacity protein-like surface antigen
MKKIVSLFAFTFLLVVNAQAQDETSSKSEPKFGIKAGFTSIALNVEVEGTSASENFSGFYIGGFAEFYLSEKLNLQPEVGYASYSEDGENSDVLLVPIMLKYKANDEFSILAGPQFDYLLNEDESEGLKPLGFGLALGASYDITENVIIDARYSFGLSDRVKEDIEEFEGFDVTAKFNYFQIGLAYRF